MIPCEQKRKWTCEAAVEASRLPRRAPRGLERRLLWAQSSQPQASKRPATRPPSPCGVIRNVLGLGLCVLYSVRASASSTASMPRLSPRGAALFPPSRAAGKRGVNASLALAMGLSASGWDSRSETRPPRLAYGATLDALAVGLTREPRLSTQSSVADLSLHLDGKAANRRDPALTGAQAVDH